MFLTRLRRSKEHFFIIFSGAWSNRDHRSWLQPITDSSAVALAKADYSSPITRLRKVTAGRLGMRATGEAAEWAEIAVPGETVGTV
jgi:hypothetical protein